MRNILTILIIIYPCISSATPQIEDVLEYNKKDYPIEQTPLSRFILTDFIIKLLKPQTMCSANWRGYKANWKIENKFLYLVEIEIDPCFNGKVVPLAVKAEWFSGHLTSPTGRWWGDEEKKEGHTVIENYKYEREVFEISNGILVEKRTEVYEVHNGKSLKVPPPNQESKIW